MRKRPPTDLAPSLLALHDELDAIRFSRYKVLATAGLLVSGIVFAVVVAVTPGHSGWLIPAACLAAGASFGVEESRKLSRGNALRREISRIAGAERDKVAS